MDLILPKFAAAVEAILINLNEESEESVCVNLLRLRLNTTLDEEDALKSVVECLLLLGTSNLRVRVTDDGICQRLRDLAQAIRDVRCGSINATPADKERLQFSVDRLSDSFEFRGTVKEVELRRLLDAAPPYLTAELVEAVKNSVASKVVEESLRNVTRHAPEFLAEEDGDRMDESGQFVMIAGNVLSTEEPLMGMLLEFFHAVRSDVTPADVAAKIRAIITVSGVKSGEYYARMLLRTYNETKEVMSYAFGDNIRYDEYLNTQAKSMHEVLTNESSHVWNLEGFFQGVPVWEELKRNTERAFRTIFRWLCYIFRKIFSNVRNFCSSVLEFLILLLLSKRVAIKELSAG